MHTTITAKLAALALCLGALATFCGATVTVESWVPFTNSTPVFATSTSMHYGVVLTMYFADNGDAILISCPAYFGTSLDTVWQVNIPAQWRGSSYTFQDVVSVSSSLNVTLLVTRNNYAFLMVCSKFGCAQKGSAVFLPLTTGDTIQRVHKVDVYHPTDLLLISSNKAIPFDSGSMQVSSSPLTWTAYAGNYSFNFVTSATWLGWPRQRLFVSIGTSSQAQGVGAMVSLSQHLAGWSLEMVTFFEHTPSNMASDGGQHLYWAQTGHLRGLLWKWPNVDVISTGFLTGERWSSRLAPEVQYDGSIVLASGNPTSHAGFTFWTPDISNLKFRSPQYFTSARGWALPDLSETTSQGLVVSSRNSLGGQDLLLLKWYKWNTEERTKSQYKFGDISRDSTSANSAYELNFKPNPSTDNCRSSYCDIDSPGDCSIGLCWGTGAKGSFMCCKHPPV